MTASPSTKSRAPRAPLSAPMISACLLTLLSGCASFGIVNPLPPLPAELKACLAREPEPLPPGPYSRADAVAVIGGLVISEDAYRRCGREIEAFYETLAAATRKRRANQP